MAGKKTTVKAVPKQKIVALTLLDGCAIDIVGTIVAVSSKSEVLLPEDGTYETHIFSTVYTSNGVFTVKETREHILKQIG